MNANKCPLFVCRFFAIGKPFAMSSNRDLLSDDYTKAADYAKNGMVTSNVESDPEDATRRSRKPPARLIDAYDGEDDDDVDDDGT